VGFAVPRQVETNNNRWHHSPKISISLRPLELNFTLDALPNATRTVFGVTEFSDQEEYAVVILHRFI